MKPMRHRYRRNRRNDGIRRLVRETELSVNDLIYPMFVVEGSGIKKEISTMPGNYHLSIDCLVEEGRRLVDLGIPAVNLFGYCEDKDLKGTGAYNPDGLVQRALRALKADCPALYLQTDVALDPYTTTGHDGLVVDGEIVNDETVDVLCKQAVSHAEAGGDMITPSDMMDGRIGAIRDALDAAGYQDTAIMSYAAKYASCFYGPFRGALDSAPREGDKKTYQMDPANRREAVKEVTKDVEEGADVVMVKPALAYLDVIAEVRRAVDVPVAAYHVSGEYGMIMAAAEKGWLDLDRAMVEATLAIKRAGADMILTYFAPKLAEALA
ncbi:porphobilinogen synthase [Acanthopleuribacter pedis]|uniref:Delta-aminolevulinic acid dehydratase n=1 Tax=Acanthopleuribacter pedis TaxID=442870 RepID=A0A8J7Q8P0_9BACT|nr:porphobilinogen synthase [Acanthopleuribacter pedis]MBO1318949.1 porphobilinogen synthase [Acanthopleuribacter pedis]